MNKTATRIKVFLAFILLFTACSTETPSEKETNTEKHHNEEFVFLNEAQRKALNLKLGKILVRNMASKIKVNGQLEIPPAARADISAVIGGNVKHINVFYGDYVRRGQLLAVLEHPDYLAMQERYAKLANQMEFLKQEYERQKKLFENNAGAGKNYQKAKADYFSAKAELQALKTKLLLLHISPEQVAQGKFHTSVNVYSPINGYVNKINIHSGAYVSPKDLMFEIINNSELHADFMVYEKDVPYVRKGQKVLFTTTNLPGKEFSAVVYAVGKRFETDVRAVHVHAELDKHPKDFVVGTYVLGYIYTDTLNVKALPKDAIAFEGDEKYIFITKGISDKTGKMQFKRVKIKTGREDDHYVEIRPLEEIPADSKVALNAAYYLLAEMKKEETGHDH